MTQKTTLPGTFSGPRVAQLPKFLHGPGVSSGLIRRYAVATVDASQIGRPVATLADSTGTGAPLTQEDTALQPIARQDGRIRYLEFTRHAMAADYAGGTTIAALVRWKGRPVSGYFPAAQMGGGGNGAVSIQPNGSLISYGSAALGSTLTPGTGWHVVIASFAGTASVIQLDGASVTGDAGITNNRGSGTTLGKTTASGPDNAVVPVDVAEVLIWNRNLTAAERSKVNTDLHAAFGL